MSNTTREQAINAIASVERVYGPLSEETTERLVDILTAEPGKEFGTRAEEFRRELEGIRPGGGASKNTTYQVFGTLNRMGETNRHWI